MSAENSADICELLREIVACKDQTIALLAKELDRVRSLNTELVGILGRVWDEVEEEDYLSDGTYRRLEQSVSMSRQELQLRQESHL